MPTIVNTEQAEAWNGDEGSHWADNAHRWNAINEPFNESLIREAGIAASDTVLDIGCGTGQTTRLAARTVYRGTAQGLDLSAPMLAHARAAAAAEGLANVTFTQGDAQVHLLPPGRFAAAISRFGIMFFTDPAAAFTNIVTALRPGGRFAFVCMADPARSDWPALLAQLRAYVPAAPAPEPDGPGMFSLADPTRIRTLLGQAGFAGVTVTATEGRGVWGTDAADTADFLLHTRPAQHLLAQAGPGAETDARATLTAALRAHEGTDGVRLRTGAWLVTARRP